MAQVIHVVPVGLSRELGVPGPLHVAAEIARNLDSNVQHHRILTTVEGSVDLTNDPRFSGLDTMFVRSRRLGIRSWGTQWSIRLVVELLRLPKSSTLHLHWGRTVVGAVVVWIVLLRRFRVLVQTHGSVRPSKRIALRVYDRIVTRPLLRTAACSVALQENEFACLVGLGSRSAKTLVIPNTHELLFSKSKETLAEPPLILFVGNLRADKRPDIFIETAEKVVRAGVHAQFVLAGQGNAAQVADLTLQCDSAGVQQHVRFVGFLAQKALLDLYSKSFAYISTSDREPFAVSALQALATGTPCIISPGFEAKERFTQLGAVVVPENESSFYADIICHWIQNRAEWTEICSTIAEKSSLMGFTYVHASWKAAYAATLHTP